MSCSTRRQYGPGSVTRSVSLVTSGRLNSDRSRSPAASPRGVPRRTRRRPLELPVQCPPPRERPGRMQRHQRQEVDGVRVRIRPLAFLPLMRGLRAPIPTGSDAAASSSSPSFVLRGRTSAWLISWSVRSGHACARANAARQIVGSLSLSAAKLNDAGRQG